MQRRFLADTINEDAVMQRLGILANLLYDRLLTLTDEAGLVAGEPKVVWGRCCAEMPGVEVKHVETAINKLVEAKFLFRREWNGRVVLLFKPEAFNRIQGFRKDYKRKFSFGELSQVVWAQGLPAFTVNPNGSAVNPNGSTASVAVVVAVTDTVTELPLPDKSGERSEFKYPDDFEAFWRFVPSDKKTGKGAAYKVWKRMAETDRAKATDRMEWTAGCFRALDPDKQRIQFLKDPQGWLSGRKFDDNDEAVKLLARGK